MLTQTTDTDADERMHADPETDTGADADVDAGTHRATRGMMLECFPALAASISRRAPDKV